ncbi:MAG: DUF4097 family beta strand repeat-containing protein [Mobilitalea sp.]
MRTFSKIWLSIGLLSLFFGIAILIIVIISNPFDNEIRIATTEGTYTGVEHIDFEIAYGDVEIIEGNSFSINAVNLLKDELESYVSEGTWYIRANETNSIKLFGSSFQLKELFGWREENIPKITITIPKDFVAGNFRLDISAGQVEADTIHANTGDFNVDAGRLSIDELSLSESSKYRVGAGEMVLKNVNLKDIDLECGVGRIQVEGTVIGDNSIETGVGDVSLLLKGNENDYNYKFDVGIGDIEIDGYSHHRFDNIKNNETGNLLNLECGIGKITVDFN